MSKLPAAVGRPRPDRTVAAADLSGGAGDWNTLAVVAEAAAIGGARDLVLHRGLARAALAPGDAERA